LNAKTHIAITKRAYELLPDQAREFIKATPDEITFWAVYPDKLDQDNLDAGYWMHSRKMTAVVKGKSTKLIWKHGSLSLAIGALRWNFRTHYRLGEFDMARICLLRMFHYCIDACTLPHVVFKDADFLHTPFERDMEREVFMQAAQIKTSYQALTHPDSIYDSATQLAEETYNQRDRLIASYGAPSGGNINADNEFKMFILRRAVQACVDFVSATYLAISQEDNLSLHE
jgi:hypothetical protein